MKNVSDKIRSILGKARELVLKGKDWAVSNYKIAIPILVAIVLLAIILIAQAVTGDKNKNSSVSENGLSANAVVVPVEPLEENAYPEVNALVSTYYTALADGDMDTIVKSRNYTEETEKIRLQKKSQYVEKYENLICYTKKGLVDNSYLAYVYSEVKFNNIDTLVPALNTLYICPNENGELYIFEGEIDNNVTEYLKGLSTQDDVVDLFNKVEVKYKEAIDSDPALSTFMTELPTQLKTEVALELAALEKTDVSQNEVSENAVEAPVETVSADAAEATQTPAPAVETVKAITTVNVRSSDSETADKVGKAAEGNTYTRLEVRENGWSKIDFEGTQAYVKTEFLEVVDTQAAATTDTATTDTSTDTAATLTTGQKVTVKETVNIRKSASETGEKLGVAYKGEQFELIMQQADGWCKITYKGEKAFVKTEFLEQ